MKNENIKNIVFITTSISIAIFCLIIGYSLYFIKEPTIKYFTPDNVCVLMQQREDYLPCDDSITRYQKIYVSPEWSKVP